MLIIISITSIIGKTVVISAVITIMIVWYYYIMIIFSFQTLIIKSVYENHLPEYLKLMVYADVNHHNITKWRKMHFTFLGQQTLRILKKNLKT